MRKKWSAEQIEYLEENWGEVSIKTIAQKISRSSGAVISKAQKLGLGSCYKTGEYLNAYEVSKIMGVDSHMVPEYWIVKYGLKGRKRVLKKLSAYQIELNDLVKWLKNNQDKWDSRKVELYALGKEPQWLKDKRKSDLNLPKKQFQIWTKEQDEMLINYYYSGKKQREIAEIMGRSIDGIEKRIHRLRKKGLLYNQGGKRHELYA